jgi:Ca2+-binding EF-hand superfamily protein
MMPHIEARPMTPRRGRGLIASTAAASLLAATVAAWAQLPSPQELRQQFAETDRNADGKVDREEFHRRSVELFYFLDRDRKGYLVIVDLKTMTPGDFKAADRSGDGRLSLDEFTNGRFTHFDLADTDGDGVLTLQEVEIYTQRVR